MLFLCIACENETAVLLPEDDDLVPVKFSMDMAPGTFETSSEIEPMHAKSDPVPYTVLKFSEKTYFIALKQVEGGWVVDKFIEGLIEKGSELKSNDLTLPKFECELRPGIYRFMLFANCLNVNKEIKENLFVKDPSIFNAIYYDNPFGSTKSLLGSELFIAKTEEIEVRRNTNLDETTNRQFALKLERMVGMLRLPIATNEILTGQNPRLSFDVEPEEPFCTTVNLFGDPIKGEEIKTFFGLLDVINSNIFSIDGKNFYFGEVSIIGTNRTRYFLLSKSQPKVKVKITITHAKEGAGLPTPVVCNIDLKLNAINGIVLYKEGENYTCYEKEPGKPYPVDFFGIIPNCDYIELNNGIR